MDISSSRLLNDQSRKEFGLLLLLDHLMRYDLLQIERSNIEEEIFKMEGIVEELKKGFFHSEEQEEELNFQKKELGQARDALTQIVKEMDENEKFRINIALVEKDQEKLEPILKFMEERSILTVGVDNYYKISKKGLELYSQLVDQLESYLMYFDVFAYVDLENGIFGDPNNDLLEGNQWTDLRVAIAEFKGMDPFRVVFLAMMSDEKFFENPDWKFELGLGTLFDELEQIVKDQVSVNDLSYEDDIGIVNGEDVIRDILKQGESLAKERIKSEIDSGKKLENDILRDEQVITKNYSW